MTPVRTAIVHYWWLSNRGGEAVVSALIDLFPDADVFLHVADRDLVLSTLGAKFKGRLFTSFVGRLPGAKKHYQKYMPLMPLALEQWDLSDYDLVISSESGPAKGVITRPDALHICYCHSPMRYLWDMYPEYLSKAGRLIRMLFPVVAHWLRVWDRASADRVDVFVANSTFISSRIRKFYRRDSEVIFPPVSTAEFSGSRRREDFYLCLGQLVPYKRADLAVEAFNKLGLPLVVIGEGELLEGLRRSARPNVTLLGRQPFSTVKDHLERCRALVFPGVEDFGIVPVEAMAAGAPVIAYARGGALDTVVDGVTGLLMTEQSTEALVEAVGKIERQEVTFSPDVLTQHARAFDRTVFQKRIGDLVQRHMSALHGAG